MRAFFGHSYEGVEGGGNLKKKKSKGRKAIRIGPERFIRIEDPRTPQVPPDVWGGEEGFTGTEKGDEERR